MGCRPSSRRRERSPERTIRWQVGSLVAALCVGFLWPEPVAGQDLRLLQATKAQDWAQVRSLLEQKADVKTRQGDGATALHWAVYHDELAAADAMVRAGAPLNTANDLGVTPLDLACDNGSAAMVEKLLAAGANPNATLPSGETLLMTAARSGSGAAVKALLARGAAVNVREKTEGQTALMWAVSRRAPAVVKALIDAGADVKARSNVRREVVARSLNTDRPGAIATIEEGGFTPLLFAARQGDTASAELLLAAGADVNDTAPFGTSTLVVAAHSGRGAFAAFLLTKGADPDAAGAGYTALHAAVLRGDTILVKALLAHGANPNARMTNGSPVGRQASTRLVLDAALSGATPFFLAAKYVEVEAMRALAEGGANTRLGLDDGTTPLMVAAGMLSSGLGRGGKDRREREVDSAEIELTLTQNEDTRRTMGSGIEGVKLAVQLGADVNAVNQAGETALFAAAYHGFNTVIQFLVEKGARLDVKNKRGQTLLMTATGPRASGRQSLPLGSMNDRSTEELLRRLGLTQ